LFASLLASADLVFRRELEEVMQFLSLERLPEYVFRLVYIALAAMALLGAYLHAATKSRNERLVGLERPIKLAFLGFTEASVVLGAVVILFAAFVVVQFKYFFGGEANIDLEGYTYAQYARRGYGELMAVAFFSLMLILALGAVTRRAVAKQQRWFSGLSVCIVGLVGVMLVSAFMRLILYESAYGFSRLRTYVHVSLAWLGFLLLAVVILELLHRPRLVALATLVASVGFAITLGVLNVDSFIVRQNVARALRGEELDIAHLASLSSDAIPPLASSFHDESVAPETRQALGAALACYIERTQPVSTDWRSFNLSRWYADRALASVKAELTGYEIGGEPWLPTITTPNGSLFECLPMYD